MSLTGIIVSGFVFAALLNVAEGRTPAPNNGTERDVVAQVIHDSICWALTKDKELQWSTMAKDEDLTIIWTSSNGNARGWKEFVRLFDTFMDRRFKATLTEIRDLSISFSRSGDVAWFSATLDDLGEWDGAPVGDRNIRWTGVLEKRDGHWLFVQQHGSVAKDAVPRPAEDPDE